MNSAGSSAVALRKRLVIGGPRRSLLEGLRDIASRHCHVLAVSSNFTVIHQAVRMLAPDCVVVDCGIGCWDIDSVVERLSNVSPGVRILSFVPDDRMEELKELARFHDPSVALLPANASEEMFRETLWQILGVASPAKAAVLSPPLAEVGLMTSQNRLTRRQLDILSLICAAESTKGIAQILDISTRTVEFHKYRMMNVLSVNTMAELILFGITSGMVRAQSRPPAIQVEPRGSQRMA